MAVKVPANEKPGVPAYMVSFGDMITLLLTFFILLVALADTQEAGLVGAGHGPLVKHLNAKGEPAILDGRLVEFRQKYKQDAWWVPDHAGAPDELVEVKKKLVEEVPLSFDPNEYQLSYADDAVRLRLSLAGEALHDEGRLYDFSHRIATVMRKYPDLNLRVSSDVPGVEPNATLWGASLQLARTVTAEVVQRGVDPTRIDQWGWGAARSLTPNNPLAAINLGVTIEVYKAQGSVE